MAARASAQPSKISQPTEGLMSTSAPVQSACQSFRMSGTGCVIAVPSNIMRVTVGSTCTLEQSYPSSWLVRHAMVQWCSQQIILQLPHRNEGVNVHARRSFKLINVDICQRWLLTIGANESGKECIEQNGNVTRHSYRPLMSDVQGEHRSSTH